MRNNSPYRRAFPGPNFIGSTERRQREVVRVFHFTNSEEELPEPQTEPRAPNQSRTQLLLQTGDTSATRKLLGSEQGHFLSDSRNEN